MRKLYRRAVWIAILILIALVIWRKTHIVILVRVAPWQLLLGFAVVAVVLYVALEALFGRD